MDGPYSDDIDAGVDSAPMTWRTEMTAGGTRYVLPRRRIAGQKAIGLGLVAFGFAVPGVVLFLSRGLWWASAAGFVKGQAISGVAGWFGLISLAMPLLVMLFMSRVVRFGLLVAFGHARITVTAQRVVAENRWGLVRHRRKVDVSKINRVIIEPGLGARPGKPAGAPGHDLANLVVDREHIADNKRKLGLAHGYPRELVDALAAEIGERIDRPVDTEIPKSLKERMGEPEGPAPAPARHVRRPRRATGTLTTTPDGVSISLPSVGYFKGSKGLGSFAILWCGFISIFTAVFVGSMVKKGINGGDVFAMCIIGVFWIVGLAMFYGALRSGRRRGLIDVAGSDLLITRQSLGKPRAESWNATELDVVCIGPSGTTVNDRPVLELQVHLKDGGKRGFFPERRDDELRWIAGEISAALGIGAEAPDADAGSSDDAEAG